jgi:hypothetical protein
MQRDAVEARSADDIRNLIRDVDPLDQPERMRTCRRWLRMRRGTAIALTVLQKRIEL